MLDKSKFLKSYIIGVLLSLLFTTVLVLLCTIAFTVSKKIPLDFIEYILIGLTGVSVFFSSLIAGRINTQNGLVLGLAIGATIFAAILISGFAMDSSSVSILTLIKAVVILLCSSLGAILGVNKKDRIHIK